MADQLSWDNISNSGVETMVEKVEGEQEMNYKEYIKIFDNQSYGEYEDGMTIEEMVEERIFDSISETKCILIEWESIGMGEWHGDKFYCTVNLEAM